MYTELGSAYTSTSVKAYQYLWKLNQTATCASSLPRASLIWYTTDSSAQYRDRHTGLHSLLLAELWQGQVYYMWHSVGFGQPKQ